MRNLSLIGIFVGALLLIVAVPHIDTLRVSVAGVASTPIPAIFATFLVLAAVGAIIGLVYGVARSSG